MFTVLMRTPVLTQILIVTVTATVLGLKMPISDTQVLLLAPLARLTTGIQIGPGPPPPPPVTLMEPVRRTVSLSTTAEKSQL